MSVGFVGEIRMFGFGFTPVGWQACDGSLLPIAQNEALFALIGTTYGGDGQLTFAVPDLRGRVPIHQGQGPGLSNYSLGQRAGTETVTLTQDQMPPHTHAMPVSTAAATSPSPANAVPAADSADPVYAGTSSTSMAPNAVGLAGGGQPHDNCMPTLTVQIAIALDGVFPSQA